MPSTRPIILAIIAAMMVATSSFAQRDVDENTATSEDDDATTDSTDDADTPAPDETPSESTTDVDALRREYLKLRDKLFRSRARAAAVGSALYSTQVRINLDYKSGRFYSITRATIRLDGSNIFDDTDGSIASNSAPRFEGYIAPGRHVMSVRIEAAGKDDERFTSVIENTFVVQAVAGNDLAIYAKAADDGNIPYQWRKSQQGSYKLHLDVDVKSLKRQAKSSTRVPRGKN